MMVMNTEMYGKIFVLILSFVMVCVCVCVRAHVLPVFYFDDLVVGCVHQTSTSLIFIDSPSAQTHNSECDVACASCQPPRDFLNPLPLCIRHLLLYLLLLPQTHTLISVLLWRKRRFS